MDIAQLFQYSIISVCAIGLVPIYRLLAQKLNLVDVPNERSSHTNTTLLGAGIILVLVFIIGQMVMNEYHWMLTAGLVLGAATGFADDKYNLKAGLRAGFYAISAAICLLSIPEITEMYHWTWLILILIVSIGTVNAYNFMDGINGITILYTLVFVSTALFVETRDQIGIPLEPMISIIIGSVVFSYLNLRKKALAFMGDVGSVFLGLILVYWMVYLITFENSIIFLCMFLVYGIDSVLTIIERLLRRENIFSAHRRHLYQFLCNEMAWPHLRVSVIYASVQAFINIIMLYAWYHNYYGPYVFLTLSFVFGMLYFILKYLILHPRTQKGLKSS